MLRRREPNPWAALEPRKPRAWSRFGAWLRAIRCEAQSRLAELQAASADDSRLDDQARSGELLDLAGQKWQAAIGWLIVVGFVVVVIVPTFLALGDALGLWSVPHWVVELGQAGGNG